MKQITTSEETLIISPHVTNDDPVRGALYVDTALTNTANGTQAKLAGAGSTTSITLKDVDENSAENRLRYTGTKTRWFRASAKITCTHSVNNTVITVCFAKNGTADANSEMDRKVGTGGDVGSTTIEHEFELATNDYVEVFADADNAGTTSWTKGSFRIIPL